MEILKNVKKLTIHMKFMNLLRARLLGTPEYVTVEFLSYFLLLHEGWYSSYHIGLRIFNSKQKLVGGKLESSIEFN